MKINPINRTVTEFTYEYRDAQDQLWELEADFGFDDNDGEYLLDGVTRLMGRRDGGQMHEVNPDDDMLKLLQAEIRQHEQIMEAMTQHRRDTTEPRIKSWKRGFNPMD